MKLEWQSVKQQSIQELVLPVLLLLWLLLRLYGLLKPKLRNGKLSLYILGREVLVILKENKENRIQQESGKILHIGGLDLLKTINRTSYSKAGKLGLSRSHPPEEAENKKEGGTK